MPLETARSIRKLGFMRWYERQLIESHAWLVTCLLCSIGIAVSLEGVNFREIGTATVTFVFIFAAGAICWQAIRRYQALMAQAEHLASQTTCGSCGTYARFRVLDTNSRMRVCCRKCSTEWLID